MSVIIINLLDTLSWLMTEIQTALTAVGSITMVLFLLFLSGIDNFNNPPLNQHEGKFLNINKYATAVLTL